MKKITLFFMVVCAMLFNVDAFGGVGNKDSRYYVTPEMWATEPYKKFVELKTVISENAAYECTAQYVAPNLILSAGHCVYRSAIRYFVRNYKGLEIPVQLLDYKNVKGKVDYAVFLVTNSEHYSDSFFDLEQMQTDTEVINAGFGWVRILSDDELQKIRDLAKNLGRLRGQRFFDALEVEMNNKNILSLAEKPSKLKASMCKVFFTKTGVFKRKIGFFATNCDSWMGNSGGGYISADGTKLYGVCSEGTYGAADFEDARNKDFMYPTQKFYETLQSLKQQYASQFFTTSQNVPNPTNNVVRQGQTKTEIERMESLSSVDIVSSTMSETQQPTLAQQSLHTDPEQFDDDTQQITNHVTAEDIQVNITEVETDVNALTEVLNANTDFSELSDEGLLSLLDKWVERDNKKQLLEQLQDAYDKAKAREQSLGNRMLTAATVAATGIGGMELAQGLSEQKADKEAAADMAAYIETMRCEYGTGKTVKAGRDEIELLGGNDEKLGGYRAEYFALANDLKDRKTALGMKPGIESEEILDKSNSGLYDDENTGITGGNEASLYRAQMSESTADQEKLDELSATSQKRVKGGAIALGAGIVGGIAGNAIINNDSNNENNNKDADGDEIYTGDSKNSNNISAQLYNKAYLSDLSSTAETTYGCPGGHDIAASISRCNQIYTDELARCKKCVNNAGTYEKGRCYVEIIGWLCLGKGWNPNKTQNPAPCNANERYQDCRIVRKYVDVEQEFVCDPASYVSGAQAVLSGCGQHGWSAGDKHPPMNIAGDNKQADCRLPLKSNNNWRSAYKRGTAVSTTYNGKNVLTTNWCMPTPSSGPWNSKNHTGAAKHLLSSSLMGGGETKSQWFSLD